MERLLRLVALYGVLLPGAVVVIALGVAASQSFPPEIAAFALAFAFAIFTLVATSGMNDRADNVQAAAVATPWQDLHEHDEWDRTSSRIVAIRSFFIGGFVIAGAALTVIYVA